MDGDEIWDVLVVGGGPAGLSATLALGRARKRVLLCDSGPRRNVAATHVNNFVTRDGTPPDELRAAGRRDLARYPNVSIADTRVVSIEGSRGAFRAALEDRVVTARRLLLCTGMIDEMLAIEGFAQLWGHAVFQCPYCHGWEVKDRRWGYLALPAHAAHVLPFAMQLRGWSRDVVVFTGGALDLPDDARARLASAGIAIETASVARLVAAGDRLEGLALAGGRVVPCDVLFAHPPQRQVEVVRALGLELDDDGVVRVDPNTCETSAKGIYAAGDLTTRRQGAIFGAAAGTQAAAAINLELTMELASTGAL